MSQTRAQRKKQSKKKTRERSWARCRNMKHQAALKKWRLDVYYGEHWNIGFKSFSKWCQVEDFREETEALREKGVEIIAGRIVNTETGKIVMNIEPSDKRVDPKDVGDKLSGPEEAKASKMEPVDKTKLKS